MTTSHPGRHRRRADSSGGRLAGIDDVGLAFGVAAGMALFTILFGTRNVDAKEQHHGVVAAIAFEAVVKLVGAARRRPVRRV